MITKESPVFIMHLMKEAQILLLILVQQEGGFLIIKEIQLLCLGQISWFPLIVQRLFLVQ